MRSDVCRIVDDREIGLQELRATVISTTQFLVMSGVLLFEECRNYFNTLAFRIRDNGTINYGSKYSMEINI